MHSLVEEQGWGISDYPLEKHWLESFNLHLLSPPGAGLLCKKRGGVRLTVPEMAEERGEYEILLHLSGASGVRWC